MLAKYGFKEARSYFIDYDAGLYVTEPIAAAPHGHQFGDPLPSTSSAARRQRISKFAKKADYSSGKAVKAWANPERDRQPKRRPLAQNDRAGPAARGPARLARSATAHISRLAALARRP